MKDKKRILKHIAAILVLLLFVLLAIGSTESTPSYYGGSSYYDSGSGSGNARTYSYTFHNESSYAVTVRVEGVTTFILAGGSSRTVNIPDYTDFLITCTLKNVTWDSVGSNIYIYTY